MNCERCGIYIDLNIIEKRKSRGVTDLRCHDCRMKPAHYVKVNKVVCTPHKGEVDDDFNPLDKKGRLYLPGIRTCGHKDCITKTHIIPDIPTRDIELERLDISYRTGKKATLQDIMKELKSA